MSRIFASESPEVTPMEREHLEVARKLAGECVVLLENDGVLPLEKNRRIALYGSGARKTVKGGTGSGDVYSRTVTTIEEGLKAAGFQITTAGWLDRYDKKWEQETAAYQQWLEEEARRRGVPVFSVMFDHPQKGIAPAAITEEDIAASGTDTAVYVIARNSGEGADRFCEEGDYLLFPEEAENLALLGKRYTKVVAVLNTGGIMDAGAVRRIPGIGSIVLMGQLGNIGGIVLADVLTGAVNPSGKLTDTWAKDYYDYPSSKTFSHNNGNVSDEYYTEGIYVGYRYFDTFQVEPVYCFGYGKSYTDFSIEVEQASLDQDQVKVQVKVTNTGSRFSGKEVVQLYVSAPEGELAKPYQELKAFEKTKELKPGQSQQLTLCFSAAQMASYSEARAAWVLEAGTYVIRVGNSSRNTVEAAHLELDRTVVTEQVKNIFPLDCELKELELPASSVGSVFSGGHDGLPQAADVPVLKLRSDAVPVRTAVYQESRPILEAETDRVLTLEDVRAGRCSAEELTAQLTVEEMAQLCVGTMRMGDEMSIVGNASYTVPGAAGDTSAILEQSRGIRGLILADGPAGLRLQPHFQTDADGNLLGERDMFGGSGLASETDAGKEIHDYYQYCTAIPVGWSLAQSWNRELVSHAGSVVGEEMEQFHVDLWLAPALNIHRNPLCGRNFEYYSEDPLISGRMAAAITQGVQSHPGKGTTIKHFAVNNQEDNRYFTNAHVSERALREIYLKGFEIAVRESQPFSIMTSYNLLNGTHTANLYSLIQSAARDEWGFDGVVMTDWFTSQNVPVMTGKFESKYPISASTGCIYAGNDLQMPGCRENVDDIIRCVTAGGEIDGYRITLADLQFCTLNVIRAVLRCTDE